MATSNPYTSGILGGDYAGLSATFSSKTGELVPVPEHLVPDSMIEWGEIPQSLETLSSEDWSAEGGTASTTDLERTTITVLPEVGCGVDNLEVTKRSESFGPDASRLERWQHARPDLEVAATDRRRGRRLDTDTLFQIASVVDEGHGCPRRLRVSLGIDAPPDAAAPSLSKLITLTVERQASPQSTRGTAWTGPSYNSGGLDARTVMTTIGKEIVYGDVFARKRIKAGGNPWELMPGSDESDRELTMLDLRWMQTIMSPDVDDVGEVNRIEGAANDDDHAPITTLRLPQNILVRYGHGVSDKTPAWSIEVSHFHTLVEDGQTRLQRRVSLRSLDAVALSQDESGNELSFGSIRHWVEERPPSTT